MTAPDRHFCAALVLCLLGVPFRSPATGQALDSSARVTRGTCPAIHCNLGMWQSSLAVPVFAAPGAAKPAFALKPRAPFEAVRAETDAVPGVHVLRDKLEVFDERTTSSLGRGDTIRTMAYLGEGRFSIEAGGRVWTALMDERDAARFQTVRPRRETWWVEVKAPGGRTGWIDGHAPGIAGASFDYMMPPLSPALLDSAFLAGLTGPVAQIVSDRGSSAGPPFEAPVDSARDGEGVVWWNAGGLRLLQLRFRTLLTPTGTTAPEHSGLPAGTVLCCGNLAYHRLVVFTRRQPVYLATITIPDQGERHVVEAFFRDTRMVRLLRDGRPVAIAYEDSVIGRTWYSAGRALAQHVPTNASASGARPAHKAGPAAGAPASPFGSKRLITIGMLAAAIVLAAAAAWWLWRRKSRAPRTDRIASPPASGADPQPTESDGWVCPYCHADVLLDLDTCWLCDRPRPVEPASPPAAEFSICGCGQVNPKDARSCGLCGKSLRFP